MPWISDQKDTSTTRHGDCLMLVPTMLEQSPPTQNFTAFSKLLPHNCFAGNEVSEDGCEAAIVGTLIIL
ncbi:unnamed protein product [Strongylus vulgaris]|uniref:Uncharacterized protein n=1 Tax=Strongylus vulgaris TaxID=40348 RepID=A0A3P7KHH1_STRVU|nr:unnamed protein product [Strongylus vulgaris]